MPLPKHKPRELRRRLILPARMRAPAGWSDACILNISSRGLLVHTRLAATEGSTVTLCHGEYLIVARVVWNRGSRVGLISEDRLPVEQILTLGQSAPLQLSASTEQRADRYPQRRTHERSRERSRLIEFASIAVIATALSIGATVMVADALAAPMGRVRAALDAPTPAISED